MTSPSQLPLKEIQQKIDKATSILIILPSFHSVDIIAAGLSFYLSLQKYLEQKEGKTSLTIASATDPTVAYQRLYGVGDITKSLGSKNLVISLKTAHENIEKISVDEGTTDFNIIVETKSGVAKLSEKDVEFSYRGLDADLVIGIGLNNAESAGYLYTQNPSLFAERDTLLISADTRAGSFGNIHVIEPEASGTSELAAKLLRFLKFPVDSDICTNLVAGIESATVNFAQKTGSDTFAAVSWCMKEGGRRNHLAMPLSELPGYGSPAFGNQMTGYNPAPYSSSAPYMQQAPQSQALGSPFSQQPLNQNLQNLPIQPAPNQIPLAKAIDKKTKEDNIKEENDDADSSAPADWLEPKIYRGGQN